MVVTSLSEIQGPGKCIRLYSEAGFRTFDENQTPEILRGNLDTALLHLLASGVADVRTFPLMDRPDEATRAFCHSSLAG